MDNQSILTTRQSQTLKAIYKSLKDSGYPPTLADLRERLNVASNQAVLDLLHILENKGFIKKQEGMARGIKILKKGFKALSLKPIISYVGISPAGPYSEAVEDIQWVSLGNTDGGDMLIRIKGDSMKNAGINNGDMVLVKKSKEFKSGDIVLSRNDDEVTVKRFIHDDGKTYLKAENPKYKNIPIYPDTRLVGKVVRVFSRHKNGQGYNS